VPGVAYVAFKRTDTTIYPSGEWSLAVVGHIAYSVVTFTATFSCNLKFIVKDCDPATGEPDAEGYEDEYQVSRKTRATIETTYLTIH
jgi:coatomer protein complex subunit gamma